MLTIYRYLTSC